MDLEKLLKTLGVGEENLKPGMDALGAFVQAEAKKAAEAAEAKAAAETKGLKDNANKLLDEKKQLQATIESLGDLDYLQKLKELVDQDDDLKLVKNGKIDELIQKKTKTMVQTYDQKIAEEQRLRREAEERHLAIDKRWRSERLTNAVSASVSGIHDGARGDVLRMAPDFFDVDQDGVISPKEGADIWSDGRPVTLNNFNDWLKASKPWFYPGSAGSGAPGGDGKGGSQKVIQASEMGSNLQALAEGTARVAPG